MGGAAFAGVGVVVGATIDVCPNSNLYEPVTHGQTPVRWSPTKASSVMTLRACLVEGGRVARQPSKRSGRRDVRTRRGHLGPRMHTGADGGGAAATVI